ncbi:MAG: MurR/RpiR family transcriptional regulator [Lachnospiraceae bacterium]|nr:MurR/RpiR family transcriptional regulator [Lachnospiraceae bacterium]
MEQLKEALKHATLTKTSQKIAEWVLDHDTEACFITSTDLAAGLEISEASVIRFARALGFTGYMDFQKHLRQNYTDKVNKVSSTITVPYERLRASMEHTDGDYIKEFLMNTERNIESVLRNNAPSVFEQAIDLLMRSHRKFILATRANTGVASYFLLLMKHMLPDVYSTGDSSISVIDHMCDITKDDCVVLFSFPRYSELDRQALQMAEDVGAPILVITDKPSAPLAPYADILLTVDVDSSAFFNSYVGVQLIMEILCAGISRRVGASAEDKLKTVDKYLEKLGTY